MCSDATRNSATVCSFPNCRRAVWQDPDGSYSSYCGRGHRDAMAQVNTNNQAQLCKACSILFFAAVTCARFMSKMAMLMDSVAFAVPLLIRMGSNHPHLHNHLFSHSFVHWSVATSQFGLDRTRHRAVTAEILIELMQSREAKLSLVYSLVNGKTSEFCSRKCGQITIAGAPKILEVSNKHDAFNEVSTQFLQGWRHPTSKPTVVKIWKIFSDKDHNDRFARYRLAVERRIGKEGGNSLRRWHGTIRACRLGDDETQLRGDGDSALFVQSSFEIAKFGKRTNFGRFGEGIYTSATSSKANDYVAEGGGSSYRAMLLNDVVMGKTIKLTADNPNLKEPPQGYDSVVGEPGGSLNYDESIANVGSDRKLGYRSVLGCCPLPASIEFSLATRLIQTGRDSEIHFVLWPSSDTQTQPFRYYIDMRLSEDVLSIIVTLLPAGNARALLTLSKCLHDIALPQAVSSICVSKADNLVAMCQYFAGNSRHDHIRTLEIQSGALVQEHVEAENAYNCAQVMECLHEFFQKATNVTRLTLGSAELIFHDGCKSQIGHAIASLRYLSTLSLLDVGPQTISTLNELPLSIKALEMSAPEPFYTYGDWSWIRDLKPIPSVQRLRLTHFFVLSFTSLTPVSGCAWPNALCLEIGENRVPCSVYPRFFPNARCFHLGHSGIECLGEHKEADKWRNMGRITTSLEQIYEWDISERTQLVEFVDKAGCGAKWLQDMSSIVGRLSPVVLRVTISSPEELFCRQGIPVQPSKSWAQIFAYGPRLKSIELVLAEGCGRIQEYQDHSCSLSRDDCWQLIRAACVPSPRFLIHGV
ncbi:predicted protein [Postia placenta Mad-698-R]|nr:predicted protein [Postia placenta Mad-698-R]